MGPYSFAASVGSSVQALTAVWKLESVSAAHSVLREVVQAFAMLVERRAKTTAKFVYFMTVVIGEGVGGRGELSYELGNAWRAMHGGQCMEGNAWRAMHGGQCMEGNAWRNHLFDAQDSTEDLLYSILYSILCR